MSGVPFARRHIGPSAAEVEEMLHTIGVETLDALIDQTVPAENPPPGVAESPEARSEEKALSELAEIMEHNELKQSLIGMGYANTHLPAVIRRKILENPGWYTAYTPYQAEISQGRMEALLNFQTMICDLTGMQISNASLLDESTAAAEAMAMARDIKGGDALYVAEDCHPQTIALLRTRAEPQGIRVLVGSVHQLPSEPVFAVVVQYPATDGVIHDLRSVVEKIHAAGAVAIVAADLLALTLITPPENAVRISLSVPPSASAFPLATAGLMPVSSPQG